MAFKYHWKNKEASFGLPIETGVPGGTHITFEIILKKDGRYIALRRPGGIPEHELPPQAEKQSRGLLYFCHNLIRYGESAEQCVKRIIKDQAGVNVKSYRFVYLDSFVQGKDNEWAIIPHVIAEVDEIPKTSPLVTEVIVFDKSKSPDDFAWWRKEELQDFLSQYDE